MHRGCVTDPLARQWWRDYRRYCASGNRSGFSFVEYVAHRVLSLGPIPETSASAAPWYVAQCGHSHPWGITCSTWTDA